MPFPSHLLTMKKGSLGNNQEYQVLVLKELQKEATAQEKELAEEIEEEKQEKLAKK